MKPTILEIFTNAFARVLGTSWAFLAALVVFLLWIATLNVHMLGEHARLFLVELAGMFIFVHLFLVQRIYNKEMRVLHLKLDEILGALEGASNELIKTEQKPEAVVDELDAEFKDKALIIESDTGALSVKNHRTS